MTNLFKYGLFVFIALAFIAHRFGPDDALQDSDTEIEPAEFNDESAGSYCQSEQEEGWIYDSELGVYSNEDGTHSCDPETGIRYFPDIFPDTEDGTTGESK